MRSQLWSKAQIGYFKAKQSFFRFDWNEVDDDYAFVLEHYFYDETFERKLITKHEHFAQRGQIAELFGYRLWAADFLPQRRGQGNAGPASGAR